MQRCGLLDGVGAAWRAISGCRPGGQPAHRDIYIFLSHDAVSRLAPGRLADRHALPPPIPLSSLSLYADLDSRDFLS